MGAAFSGGSLCRFVGGVEILVSSVIIGFGAQTLHLFYGMDDEFRTEFERIQYSAFTAVAQGILTILAALVLFFASRKKTEKLLEEENEKEFPDENGGEDTTETSTRKPSLKPLPYAGVGSPSHQIKRKLSLIYKLWLAFSIMSVGLLLIVFVGSMTYCIQNQEDKDKVEELTEGGKDPTRPVVVDGKTKPIPRCYAVSPQTLEFRQALANLYSYCLVNIFALLVFMLVVYFQLKRVTRALNRGVKEDKQKCLEHQDNKVVDEEE